MELVSKKRLHLVSGRANLPLAEEIADALGVQLGDANPGVFANGELHCRFNESVRGTDVFIIQSHTANGYARQDRKSEGREPITAKLVANMFKVAGASRIISVDLHSGQIQGFFDGPVDHLTAMPVLCDYMAGLGDDLVVVSPDAGRVKVAERYANQLSADLAIVHKRRVKGAKNTVEARDVVGEVDGRTCVLIDDMIDTGGTIVAAAEQLMDHGATSVYVACTHGVFSGPAIDRLKNSVIAKVVTTNTLPLPPEKQIDKIEVLSVAGIIADAIDAVFEDTSVSEIFGGANQS